MSTYFDMYLYKKANCTKSIFKMYTNVELLKYGKYVKMFEQTASNPCIHVIGKRLLISDSISNITQCTLKAVLIFLF